MAGAGEGAASGAAAGAAGGPLGIIIGGALGALGGALSERQQRKFRRRQRRAIGEARKFADETVKRITEGELFSSATDFLKSTFADAADSPLAQDFAKSIRAAQSVRGTFSGNIGAAQEAVGTSGFAQRLRQSLLPQAQAFAEAPERLRQSILQTEAPLRVAAATGASFGGLGPAGSVASSFGSSLTQGVAGALGGFQIGSQFDAQQAFSAQLDALRLEKVKRETGDSTSASGFARTSGQQVAADDGFLQRRLQQFSGTA